MAPHKPVLLERKVLPKVWGGQTLARVLDLDLPGEEKIGETWELYDRHDGSSRIRDSARTLRDLMLEDAAGLLGRGVSPTPEGYFPLLLKYIDAVDELSIQVHPDDTAAATAGGGNGFAPRDGGKTEGWVVLATGPRARIVSGCKKGVTVDVLAAAFAAGAVPCPVAELLQTYRPEVGDAILVPAGTVHALGPDVVVFEVQQNSDITYRLYDWGRPRETQLEQALSVARLDAQAVPTGTTRINEDQEWLFRTPFFTTRRSRFTSPASLGTEGTFKVLSVVAGRGTLGWHSGGNEPPLVLRQGDTALIPAEVDVCFLSPIGGMELLVCGPGI